MNTPLIVGGCKLPVSLDIKQNLKEIKKAIDWAAENEVNILSTPECALSGYLWAPADSNDDRILQISQSITELKAYSLAKKVDLILGTAWYDQSNQWSDTLHFIIDGEISHVHYKNIVFEHQYTAGAGVTVITYRGKRIAGLICSDAWSDPIKNPDASAGLIRSLKEQKCDVLFVSANTPKGPQNSLHRDWHNICVRMNGHLGEWHTVVSENTYKMEGFEWDGPTGVDCGIYLKTGEFNKARGHGTDYFKQVLYERTRH